MVVQAVMMRTGLRIRFPANREKIREFSQFLITQVSARDLKRRLLKALRENSLLGGTGNFEHGAANVLSGTGKVIPATANAEKCERAERSRPWLRLTRRVSHLQTGNRTICARGFQPPGALRSALSRPAPQP